MALSPINPTQLTPPRVAFIDERSGAISREWYRFFLSLLTATQVNQEEVQLAPDMHSLLATYDAMLATLTQTTETQPDCCASGQAVLNGEIQALAITPGDAAASALAVVQSELEALAITPPSADGTMAFQNADAVDITGGTIDGTTIGATTPASARVTTLEATDTVTLAASTTSLTPLQFTSGVDPTAPTTGAMWLTPTGLVIENGTYAHALDFDTNTSGVLSMPTITITGSGATFNATSVEAYIFSLPGWVGDFRRYVIPAATGLALVDNTSNYLVVTYNSGSPAFSVTQNVADINGSNVVGAALLYRQGTEVHYQAINWGLSPSSRINRRLVQTNRYERGMGLSLGETVGRVITLTSGVIWYGVTEYAEPAVTSAASNAEFYYHVAGVWTKSAVSVYDNSQYDNGTNLVALTGAGKYAVNWIYRFIDGDSLPKLAYIVGSGDYNLAQAVAASPPAPPPVLTQMAMLVGRIIVQNGAATATQIDSAFTQVFSSTTVTNHNDLANLQGGTLNEYYHLTATEYARIAPTVPVTKTANFTVSNGETWIINNKSGSTCTVTLPAAATYPGRYLTFQNNQDQTLVSASSNVVPQGGGAAGTAILTNVSGNWATLVSNGTNWVIMQAASFNNLLF